MPKLGRKPSVEVRMRTVHMCRLNRGDSVSPNFPSKGVIFSGRIGVVTMFHAVEADMATGKSCVDFRTPHHASGCRDCVQPAAGDCKPTPGQLRCCVVQQSSYLQGDSRREFFSSKDATKRKRVNRIAKLKQCKLDARREQWLSQGSRCRPEELKQVAQHSARKEEKHALSENSKSGKDSLAKLSEVQSHPVVGIEGLNEESIITKEDDVSFFSSPCVLGSREGHANIAETCKVEVNENLELPPRTLRDDDCYKRRPGDLDISANDSEDTRAGPSILQCYSEVSGNIRGADSCYVTDFVHFRSENSQRCSESSVLGLDTIPGGPKLLDEEDEVVSHDNRSNGCSSGCRTDQTSCSSSSYASSRIAETEPDVNDLSCTHESEDDWELAADALSIPGSSLITFTSQLPGPPPEVKQLIEQKGKVHGIANVQDGILKPEYKCKASGFGSKSRGGGGRAWRPDDVSRPPTLPPLSKQLSVSQESSTPVWSGTQQSRNLWGPPQVPSCCPICTEELDLTDSSFCPCSCGFRLCLFCHHRISSDDGRCPGCRKIYSSDAAMKLSRTTLWLSV